MAKGGCLCGAIKFEVNDEPKWVAHCHCRSCQKTTGSAFVTYAGFEEKNVRFAGQMRQKYQSSQDVNRSFCSNCGTPLAYESGAWPGEIHLMVSNFENPNNFQPTLHVNMADKIAWVHLDDTLKKFDKFP